MFCRTAQHVNTTQRSKTSAPKLIYSYFVNFDLLHACFGLVDFYNLIISTKVPRGVSEKHNKKHVCTFFFSFIEFSALF